METPPTLGGVSYSAFVSSRRELIPGLADTLSRRHSTGRGRRRSRTPISGSWQPSAVQRGDLPLQRGQIVAGLGPVFAYRLARREAVPSKDEATEVAMSTDYDVMRSSIPDASIATR